MLSRFRATASNRPLIADRMVEAAGTPGFTETASGLVIHPDDTLSRLATLAAQRYASSGDFTVLHLVTSAHAVRMMLPWLEPEERADAVKHYWQNFAAAWVGGGGAAMSNLALPRGAPWPWPRIVEATLDTADEHAVKLVDSCREQAQAYGGEVWRLAAWRSVSSAR